MPPSTKASASAAAKPTSPGATKPFLLTLIVATTPIRSICPKTGKPIEKLGIGRHGTLPWPRIKSDMGFFARVTARPPRPGTTNAIIMGRKTYDSIPRQLRPLAKRINVVVTRNADADANLGSDRTTSSSSDSVRSRIAAEFEAQREKNRVKKMKKDKAADAAAAAAPVEAAANSVDDNNNNMNDMDSGQRRPEFESEPEQLVTDILISSGLEAALTSLATDTRSRLGHVFIIGGGEMYASALHLDTFSSSPFTTSSNHKRAPPPPALPTTKTMMMSSPLQLRIVMTKVMKKQRQHIPEEDGKEGSLEGGTEVHKHEHEQFECDTFFPVNADDLTPVKGWREVTTNELSRWIGEPVSPEWKQDGEVAVRIAGYERLPY